MVPLEARTGSGRGCMASMVPQAGEMRGRCRWIQFGLGVCPSVCFSDRRPCIWSHSLCVPRTGYTGHLPWPKLGWERAGSSEKNAVWLGWSHQVLEGHLVPLFLHTLPFFPYIVPWPQRSLDCGMRAESGG